MIRKSALQFVQAGVITAAFVLVSLALHAQANAPDIIFIHGNILTGTHLRANDQDPIPAHVQALAVRNSHVVAVGNDNDMLALRGAHTEVVDLHGAFAMPGFNDAHTHMALAGQQRLSVDLVGATSLADMLSRVRNYTADAKPGQWVLGGGWDHTKWPSGKLPTRQDLDAITAGHPALLYRVDGHIAVANTAALQAAGIVADTPVPVGGQIDRAPDGSLTGIIRETPAIALIEQRIPKPDVETRRKALELSIADALAHGVTSVQDFSEWDDWLVLQDMEYAGRLQLRVSEWMDFNLPVAVLQQRRASHPADDPLLHLGMLKGFMDGSLGSRTAAMNAPYADDRANAGIPRYTAAKLNAMSAERAAAGFQLGFHAIGDRGNDMALDAFAAVDQLAAKQQEAKTAACLDQHPEARRIADSCGRMPMPPPSMLNRFRIEHAQVVSPGAYDRFAKLGVIASMQPSHLLTDMAWAGDRLGPERSKRAYAWRSFLDHGVTLAFGTDYPVESISPFRGLYSAVTRMNEAGTQTFEPQERINIQEAIYAYTQASAFAEFRETVKGRLEPGYFADLVVLDRDITKASPQDLLRTRVLRTVLGGKTVYTANPKAAPLPDTHSNFHPDE